MPLGEMCGRNIPGKMKLYFIVIFSIILGITATLAEPAIGFLRAQGSSISPWRAPMLYYLLNGGTNLTIAAIAVGIGISVLCGVIRALNLLSLRPFIYTIIPVMLILTYAIGNDPRMISATGLAWDVGGVATGPVTVPLILALGLGISAMNGKNNSGSGDGFGVVMLASAFPALMVMLLVLFLRGQMPEPATPEQFFAEKNRSYAMKVLSISDNQKFDEIAELAKNNPQDLITRLSSGGKSTVFSTMIDAVKAILPLSIILFIVLTIFMREKIKNIDEIFLGVVLCLIGLALFNGGMLRGLQSLGSQTGEALPKAYKEMPRPDKKEIFSDVDESLIIKAVKNNKGIAQVIPVLRENDNLEYIPFDSQKYDAEEKTYEYIPVDKPLWSKDSSQMGYIIILLFMFVMGIGVTLAEPLLYAMGLQVEKMTGGSYKRKTLIYTVAVGVAVGVAAGFARILYDFPTMYLLLSAYALALIATMFSDDEFASIAWDSGGVTTGPITVPLVIATGMGIGSQAGVSDCFGVIASASVFPIVAVLISGIVINLTNKSLLEKKSEDKIYEIIGDV
jgi:MFS family permease